MKPTFRLPTLLLLIGESATGKTQFKQTRLVKPKWFFHDLRSATTRPMRVNEGETEGNPYFFRDEAYFESKEEPLATYLWVNEAIWKETLLEKGEVIPKWLYGVPEHEIFDNLGRNLVYDVIQPCYAIQMIKWFEEHGLKNEYNIKVAWFVPPENRGNVVKNRANMKYDEKVRDMNTCTALDILRAGLTVDYMLCPRENISSAPLDHDLLQLYNNMLLSRELQEKNWYRNYKENKTI